MLTRRAMLATAVLLPLPAQATAMMTVYKSPSCGCCGGWIAHMTRNGFRAAPVDLEAEALDALKSRLGIADHLASCHTAVVGPYVVEGHVPAADVRRLLAAAPDARGLAVPGMPQGAPGMETGVRERYDVLLVRRDGTTEVFARY